MRYPTIGIEIEVSWSSYFPQEFSQWFDNGKRRYRNFTLAEKSEFDAVCTKLDAHMLPKLEAYSRQLGLSRGKDPYWEFVFPPVADVSETVECIDVLIKNQLLPLGMAHSLHITVADIIPDTHSARLATWLEIISGVSSGRIKQGVHRDDCRFSASWARRGNRGLRQRPATELLLEAKVATEFRSLVLPNTLSEIQELLEFAQRFGSVVGDLQAHTTKNGDFSIWKRLVSALEIAGLPHSLDWNTDWGNPHEKTEIWEQYGKFLDEESTIKNLKRMAESV